MLYKQKLRVDQAFQYKGGLEENFKELIDWYREHALHSNPPFYWVGRALYVRDTPVMEGDYIVLSVDKRNVTIVERKEFESLHSKATKSKDYIEG